MSTIKEEEYSNYNNSNIDYDISMLIEKNKINKNNKEKTSKYMRKTLFQQMKNEGLYDDSEEENEDNSLEYDDENDTFNNNILSNRQREGFEFSLISDGLHRINTLKKNEKMNKKDDLSIYSIKTDYKVKDNIDNDINNNISNNDNVFENNNFGNI